MSLISKAFAPDRLFGRHRWAYASAALTGAHAIAYQYVEKRSLPFQASLYFLLLVVSIFQLAGIFKSRRTLARPQPDNSSAEG
jgi:hypothetical protein